MEVCEVCKSTNIEKDVKNLSEENTDNVVPVFKCKDCGHVKTGEVEHIG